MNNPSFPQLDKPGAGLPWIEHLFLKYYFLPFIVRRFSPDKAQALFLKEGEKALLLKSGVSEDSCNRPVLIPRLRGLEDSSRFWSINQTLEHLILVGKGMLEIVRALLEERVIQHEVHIADYKPRGIILTPEEEFQSLLNEWKDFDYTLLEKKNTGTFPHPWFGLLNAKEWYSICALHQKLHRVQLQRIREIGDF